MIYSNDVMTLHWWMHWFWVTIQITVILANPLPSTTEQPRDGANNQKYLQSTTGNPLSSSEDSYVTSTSARQNLRVAKAIGVNPQFSTDTQSKEASVNASVETSGNATGLENFTRNSNTTSSSRTNLTIDQNERTGSRVVPAKKDSRITWIFTSNKTSRAKLDDGNSSSLSSTGDNQDLTVLPLHEETTRFKLVLNKTRNLSGDGLTARFNTSEDVEIDEETAEQSVMATAASVLQASVSESTRLSRARSAFTSDFQRDTEPNQPSENNSSINSGSGSTSAVDIAAITGSCLATVVLLSTMGSLGFIMYRRRYLNPPQTLNSDKCSNPDSSGYIDDSTIRDNSEEMYSLDNDSFLNSLEAMTIQNYWTDSVKHTKL
ncbi:uncharacterized protein LOC107271345 isoform X2 [Cephus cinctus]|uniref:Uncharacterized protein LOC107271345 isoform X2 n=1 Tax=Cephus cinctus TaxID=211228 RepID=A0AAJ7FQ28_CEPCN|nr:uncharacterized protein LOC107271345 isoform X2 [Cephus cinctus]